MYLQSRKKIYIYILLQGEITKGYRKLAKKWHPDMAGKGEVCLLLNSVCSIE